MDWTLDLAAVGEALGGRTRLPSPDEFASLITEAELALLVSSSRISPRLLDAAWYLHGVASAWGAPDLYPVARRRQAFQLSAHVFDLALGAMQIAGADRLRLAFAAQIGFARSSLEPNAIAIRRRSESPFYAHFLEHPAPAVDAGGALLAFDVSWLYDRLRTYRSEIANHEADWRVGVRGTPFASSALTLDAIWQILLFVTRGEVNRLEVASGLLHDAIDSETGEGDVDSRWVAAHLIDVLPQLQGASVWTAIPPSVAPSVRRAFALAAPPVLQLWPPQLDAMREVHGRTPVSGEVRRVVLSMPTSAGKTLLAQILATAHLSEANTGVCFVAPTRALCREIDRSLRSRLRFMRRDSVFDSSDELFVDLNTDVADVAVMTPERLAYLLRQDREAVLARFGLFVFDEVHNVGDPTRGWTLETVITEVHTATADTTHRIVLMSAALGNRVHFVDWVDPAGAGLSFHFDWRGPRRLTAIFTAEAAPFAQARIVPRLRANSPDRRTRPFRGVLRVRTPDGRVTPLRIQRARWRSRYSSTKRFMGQGRLKHRFLQDPRTSCGSFGIGGSSLGRLPKQTRGDGHGEGDLDFPVGRGNGDGASQPTRAPARRRPPPDYDGESPSRIPPRLPATRRSSCYRGSPCRWDAEGRLRNDHADGGRQPSRSFGTDNGAGDVRSRWLH